MTGPVLAQNDDAASSTQGEDVGRNALLAVALVAGFFLTVAVVGWSETPTFERLGPWLATLSTEGRVGTGLVVGTCAAAPMALRLSPRVWRWTSWPAVLWLCVAAMYLSVVWLPPRYAGLNGGYAQAMFRDQAGWYIVASLAAFVGTLFWTHLAVMVREDLAIRRARKAESARRGEEARRARAARRRH